MRLFRSFHPTLLLVVTSMGLSAPLTLAQSGGDLGPKDQFLENLRTGDPTSADNKAFDQRIDTEIQRLEAAASGTELVARQGALDFVSRFMDQYNNANNTASFKEKLAERASLRIIEQFNRGAELNPVAARAMADVLSRLGSVSARDALLLGLKSTDQVVRYLCAKGLALIIDGVSADARLTQVTLDAIVEAAAKETNAVVAAAMYEALRYGNDHTSKVLAAILKVLDGRLEFMRASLQSVDAAETSVIHFISQFNGLSTEDKVAIIGRLAVLLRLSVEAYEDASSQGNEAEARLDVLEQMIVLLEELIESIVNPSGKSPDIRSEMSKMSKKDSNERAVVAAMKIELLLWIGTEQSEGLLNKDPWKVPVDAP
ncbi:MAG: hypothetical protein DHS20C16_16630 [Phycisphaerae bacterium]|nr:MAG: hypothetical protein DHS20C16_16630 [Phycisphaerae bacterium]